MSPCRTFFLFAFVIIAWGLNWTVTKIMVTDLTPWWTAALRFIAGTSVLFVIQVASRQFIIPKRGDYPVIVSVALLHMVVFTLCMAVGLQFVAVGRSAVLGYTTPLWVAPGAWLLLKEPIGRMRALGVVLGMTGLVVLLNPLALNWNDHQAVLGNGFLLLAALSWAASILYVCKHRWIATPFQLTFWQCLLATVITTIAALVFDGIPTVTWTPRLVWATLYSGILGTAFGFWAMTKINQVLPATLTSLGSLGVPVVGAVSSLLMLGEPIELPLIVAGTLILAGIALGVLGDKKIH